MVFDQLIDLNPKQLSGFFMRGKAWREKGDLDKAMVDLNKALSLTNDKNWKAAIENGIALSWRDKGNLDAALVHFNEAVRLDPKEMLYPSNRGELWRLKGDLERALADQDRAVALDSRKDAAVIYVLRGDTLRYKGEFVRAIADYEKALAIFNGPYAPALAGLGLTYERMGDLARARKQFERAALLDSGSLTDISKSSAQTAVAHLAALDSGEAQPTILSAPSKVTSATSIPTPSIARPKALGTERAEATAKQGRRIALVIGNSAYKNVPKLLNPQNDSETIAVSLRNVGFDSVTIINDATREKLIESLRTFANDAENADWAMVYYAGHGMEVNGANYLVPIDAKIAVDRDIEYEAVSLSQVLRSTDAAKKIKLIVLDACRDNPFTPRKTRAPEQIASASTAGGTIGTRSTNGRGLAEVKVTGATLVVFAAKDGQVALDGEGGNSPFTVAVVQRLATPGVEINKLFRLVRDDVMEATAGRQEPYTYGSLPGKEDFFFVAK